MACAASPGAAIRSPPCVTPECEESFTYVSAAGGAFLEWLEGKTLPGVAILES